MRKTIFRQLSLLTPVILSIIMATLPCNALLAQESADAFAQLGPNAQTVAQAINQMRAQAGLPPLVINPLLNLAAQNHVNDMLANHNYGHYGSDGSNVRQRVLRTGYSASTWVSENWVMVGDPSTAIQWWMNSYVHRNNILNHNWHELGIGAGYQAGNSQHIFVAVFTAGESSDSVVVMPPEPEPLPIPDGGLQYQIQPGDTLLSIGLRYSVEWPVIARANNLSEYSILQIGQVIRIPGVENVGGYVDEIQAASTTSIDTEPTNQPAQSNSENGFVRRYTVQPGDTLDRVAAIYELGWQDIARENGLGEHSILRIGQELRIPGVISSPNAETKKSTESPSSKPETYTVQAGDTIISIAVSQNMDWHELLRVNQLNENSVLSLGQTLHLR